MFKEFEVVALAKDLPDEKLIAGAVGTVLTVYDADPPFYEVEFCDQDGSTIALLTLKETDLRKN